MSSLPFHLSQGIETAEEAVSAELQKAEQAGMRIFAMATESGKRLDAVLKVESPQERQARETIEDLRLRLELLRNIRLHWQPFQEHLEKTGLTMRINQDAHLRHLIRFLETGKGVLLPGEKPLDMLPEGRELWTYEVQPTGAGKTGAFAIDIALMSVPSVILVPLDPLLIQTKNDLVRIGGIPADEIGTVGAGTQDFQGKKHIIATYAGHMAQMRKDGAYAAFLKTRCKLVICDEVHYQALGNSTNESIAAIDKGDPRENGDIDEMEPIGQDLTAEEKAMLTAEHDALASLSQAVRSLKIGFTATPKGAAKQVRQFFPHCLGRTYHREMIEAGSVVPYRIIQCDGSVFEGEIDGYLNQNEESKILRRERIYAKLAGQYAEVLETYRQTKDRHQEYPLRGIGFCTSHAECQALVQEAESLGIRCRIVTGKEAKGKHSQEVIDGAMADLNAERIDLIVTVEKLAVGFNRPEINAVVWARLTSAAKTIQCIGRGARSHVTPEGLRKPYCLVFETNWTLLKENKKRSTRKHPMRLADALAFNGEEPEHICAMANGKVLDVQRPLTLDQLRTAITEAYTAEQWAGINYKEKVVLKIQGLGLNAIAGRFGVKGKPIDNHSVHLELGKAIFGVLPCFEKTTLTLDQLRSTMMEIYTPEQWAELKKNERQVLKINDLGMNAIARLFGVKGNPVKDDSVHLNLGAAIFDTHPNFTREEITTVTSDQLRTTIREKYTLKEWAGLKYKERNTLKIHGLGLHAIARYFGVQGNPIGYRLVFKELGEIIFSTGPCLSAKEKTADRLRTAIRERYNPEQWAELKQKEKIHFKIHDLGLNAIARLFGVKGDPNGNHSVHLELGKAIWGAEWNPPTSAS